MHTHVHAWLDTAATTVVSTSTSANLRLAKMVERAVIPLFQAILQLTFSSAPVLLGLRRAFVNRI
jgi:hypothetical protein